MHTPDYAYGFAFGRLFPGLIFGIVGDYNQLAGLSCEAFHISAAVHPQGVYAVAVPATAVADNKIASLQGRLHAVTVHIDCGELVSVSL